MARNFYFENYEASMEQNLIEDLVIESIRIYGVDTWYLPRVTGAKDDLLNEDDLPQFNEAFMVEMYVKNVDGFEGEGDFLSKFGLQIRDSMTLTVAIKVWEQEVDVNLPTRDTSRPLEGDLIYFPLNKKFFKIMHVEHESIFYQMGSLQTYDLRLELFEYSNERFETGQEFIDDYFEQYRTYYKVSDTFNVRIGVKDFTHAYWDKNGSSNTVNESYAFYIDNEQSPIIELDAGTNYTFDLSDVTLDGYTFAIYDSETPTNGRAPEGVVSTNGTPGQAGAYYKITPTQTGTFYYQATSLDSNFYMGNIAQIAGDRRELESVDPIADNIAIDNTTLEQTADNILDFSEVNPFGENDY